MTLIPIAIAAIAAVAATIPIAIYVGLTVITAAAWATRDIVTAPNDEQDNYRTGLWAFRLLCGAVMWAVADWSDLGAPMWFVGLALALVISNVLLAPIRARAFPNRRPLISVSVRLLAPRRRRLVQSELDRWKEVALRDNEQHWH